MATEEVTAQEELKELAEAYREADSMEKTGKAAKEKLREPLFDLMSEVVREEIPLTRKTITVKRNVMTEFYDDDFDLWVKKNFPTWNVVSILPSEVDYKIEIEEDSFFVKYEFEVDGFRYGRTIVTPTPQFDVERFVREQPKLAADLVDEETKVIYTLNERKASRYMADHPDSKELFETYVKIGVPTTKMLPIKPTFEEQE